jgi:hypothetical protein
LVVPPPHWRPHAPCEQTSPIAQALPHAPQLAGSSCVSTQTLPHFSAPPLQERPHDPCEHTCSAGQAVPQAPQFVGSSCVSTHLSPHLVVPPLHCVEHAPFAQACPAGHAAPQAPQFVGSLLTSTQVSPHFVWPAGHWTPASPVVDDVPPPSLQLVAISAVTSAQRAIHTPCFVRIRFILPHLARAAIVPRVGEVTQRQNGVAAGEVS